MSVPNKKKPSEDAGLFHAFHGSWITHLYEALMDGILPRGYLALPEQYLDGASPDVIALLDSNDREKRTGGFEGPALKTAKPKAYHNVRHEDDHYSAKQRRIVVRDRKKRRIVAVLEIVSPSNKKARQGVDQFLAKSVELLNKGINLVIVDLLPPTKACPVNFHELIWHYRHAAGDFAPPRGRRLSVASYDAHDGLEVFLEPLAVGEVMPAAPLFLLGGTHVELPLEATANRAMRFLPIAE